MQWKGKRQSKKNKKFFTRCYAGYFYVASSSGSGGFGTVHQYHNNCLDMDFAVKIYEPIFVSSEEQSEGEKRVFREAKMLFSLNSPYIARIYDAGRVEGKSYIRMEYINGYTVDDLRDREGNMEFSRSSI